MPPPSASVAIVSRTVPPQQAVDARAQIPSWTSVQVLWTTVQNAILPRSHFVVHSRPRIAPTQSFHSYPALWPVEVEDISLSKTPRIPLDRRLGGNRPTGMSEVEYGERQGFPPRGLARHFGIDVTPCEGLNHSQEIIPGELANAHLMRSPFEFVLVPQRASLIAHFVAPRRDQRNEEADGEEREYEAGGNEEEGGDEEEEGERERFQPTMSCFLPLSASGESSNSTCHGSGGSAVLCQVSDGTFQPIGHIDCSNV